MSGPNFYRDGDRFAFTITETHRPPYPYDLIPGGDMPGAARELNPEGVRVQLGQILDHVRSLGARAEHIRTSLEPPAAQGKPPTERLESVGPAPQKHIQDAIEEIRSRLRMLDEHLSVAELMLD